MSDAKTNNCKVLVGLTDKYDPEVRAMLMAMYSRSYEPIESRLPNTTESQLEHKEKLGRFYIGYNHKSVGQLASTDIYFEGVSQLAAKAIENTPLFNGSESSTRYIDFTNQPMVFINDDISIWQEKWRTFYLKALPLVVDKIKLEFPFDTQPEGTKQTTWENTIKARAFDICRGFLPAGVTTSVGFSGTFDTFNDHFGEMLYHPCQEMKDIAKETIKNMGSVYKYATVDLNKQLERSAYAKEVDFFYQGVANIGKNDILVRTYGNPVGSIEYVKSLLMNLPKWGKIPRTVANEVRIEMQGFIDFGSFRDLHRHRNGYLNMPVLDVNYGINKYYIDNLTEELKVELTTLVEEFKTWYESNTSTKYEKQYCVPMGYNVHIGYECDMNQVLYLLTLRSGKTVHQSLRVLIMNWAKALTEAGFNIPADMDEDNFSLKRGTQTINVE